MALLDDLRQGEFTDRLAARILGVELEATEVAVRAAFRSRVRVVHPDTSVGDGCVDIGRLAHAKDVLVARARRRDVADAELAAELAVGRDAAPPFVAAVATGPRRTSAGFQPFDYRSGFEVVDRRGGRIDLAG